MTPADLRTWQSHMGYTYDTAAHALGVSRSTYAEWVAGKSRTTGKPVTPSRTVALARRLGVSKQGLADLVCVGRTMLKNLIGG